MSSELKRVREVVIRVSRGRTFYKERTASTKAMGYKHALGIWRISGSQCDWNGIKDFYTPFFPGTAKFQFCRNEKQMQRRKIRKRCIRMMTFWVIFTPFHLIIHSFPNLQLNAYIILERKKCIFITLGGRSKKYCCNLCQRVFCLCFPLGVL